MTEDKKEVDNKDEKAVIDNNPVKETLIPVKSEENVNRTPTMYDSTMDGIAVFEETVTKLAGLYNKQKSFIVDAIVQAKGMGCNDPLVAMGMFWDMSVGDKGKAEIKTDALQKHLIDKGFIAEPFKIIKNAQPIYRHFDKDLFNTLVATNGEKFYKDFLVGNGKLELAAWLNMLSVTLVYTGSNKELAAAGKEATIPGAVDWVTELEGIRIDRHGKAVIIRYEYYYSTAVAKGLTHNKPKGGQPAELKSTWIDKGWMMWKRCASKLAGVIAPGAVHAAEGKEGYCNTEVLEKEASLYKSATGEFPKVDDTNNIEDVTFVEVHSSKTE